LDEKIDQYRGQLPRETVEAGYCFLKSPRGRK
jgi:hypothetical protein